MLATFPIPYTMFSILLLAITTPSLSFPGLAWPRSPHNFTLALAKYADFHRLQSTTFQTYLLTSTSPLQ